MSSTFALRSNYSTYERRVAELPIDTLIRLIQTPHQQPSMVLAPPPTLVVRASTGPRRLK
ncbi:hypothetical protein B0G80_6849 [Paraburkholderia sp. BL6669N2]|uniref:hypothetical protein n=1 Tax=Paraburkholderia sp. BL6669N2 TaxID=1938807 RepID=UPI000E3AB478|nr:hypothetical protein [Paraburkholderia sp. BL6669N2]REG50419.1 hypothetical protein B0G80_6849 [Paraburkholderia sp. BL6669N2]